MKKQRISIRLRIRISFEFLAPTSVSKIFLKSCENLLVCKFETKNPYFKGHFLETIEIVFCFDICPCNDWGKICPHLIWVFPKVKKVGKREQRKKKLWLRQRRSWEMIFLCSIFPTFFTLGKNSNQTKTNFFKGNDKDKYWNKLLFII